MSGKVERLWVLTCFFSMNSLHSSTGSSTRAASDTFQKRLSEGSVYSLNGFDVGRSNPKFRLSDTPVSIRFSEGTFFEEKNTDEWFRFRSHKQFLTHEQRTPWYFWWTKYHQKHDHRRTRRFSACNGYSAFGRGCPCLCQFVLRPYCDFPS